MKEFRNFSKLLSEKSASIIRKYFRTHISVDTKGDFSPVTIADKSAEEAMREMIMKEYPEHGILGEEFGAYNEGAEYQWILDPIDGTKSFICGALSFGTLIALMKNGKPMLGVINHPVLNEFLIGDNITAEINGVKTQARPCGKMEDAVLLTTDHLSIEKYKNIEKFNELTKKVKLYRAWGDCYGYYLFATGYADVMIDAIMSPWDTMALIPIINGAGGVITDYEGGDALTGTSTIASAKEIHKEVIEALN